MNNWLRANIAIALNSQKRKQQSIHFTMKQREYKKSQVNEHDAWLETPAGEAWYKEYTASVTEDSIRLAVLDSEQRRLEELAKVKPPKPPRRKIKGFVYVILGVPMPWYRCKIGRTAGKVSDRFNAIQSCSPLPLELLLVIETEDTARLEKGFHEHFSHRHAHNEWFDLKPSLISEMKAIGTQFGTVVYKAERF